MAVAHRVSWRLIARDLFALVLDLAADITAGIFWERDDLPIQAPVAAVVQRLLVKPKLVVLAGE